MVETATSCDQLPQTLTKELAQNADFWKHMFTALTETGLVQVYLPSGEGI